MSSFRGSFSYFVKTILGILIIALVISGIAIYFARQNKPVIYRFNPKNAYVYTFHNQLYSLSYEVTPLKSVTLLSDGFHPLCLLGCRRAMEGEEVESALIRQRVKNGKDNSDSGGRFVYLRPGSGVSINFDLGIGRNIKQKYPYANKLIVEFDGDSFEKELSIVAEAYSFEDRQKNIQRTDTFEREFNRTGTFGDSLVFSLDRPYFISRLCFILSEDSDAEVGLRGVSVYLQRSRYISLIARQEGIINQQLIGAGEEKGDKIRKVLKKAASLDPYSPKTDFLLARTDYILGNYERALEEINSAIEKLKKYGDLLNPELGVKDFYEIKARIMSALGSWKEAILYMKRTVPEVDHQFLSEVYLKKYRETRSLSDLKNSYFHGLVGYKGTPRLSLDYLEKYGRKGSLLRYGLSYFREELDPAEGNSYTLSSGQTVSGYIVCLSRGLLNFWLNTEESLARGLEQLEAAEKIAGSKEKIALVKAVESEIMESRGRKQESKPARSKAISFFDNYSGLYKNWLDFIGED